MQCAVAPAGRYSARNVAGHAPPNAPVHGEADGRVAGQDVRLAHDVGQRPEQRARKRHALAMV